jgi:hypothetical protein
VPFTLPIWGCYRVYSLPQFGRYWMGEVQRLFHPLRATHGADILTGGRAIARIYLAPEDQPLDFEVVDGYARIALPPVKTHAVVVLEWRSEGWGARSTGSIEAVDQRR